MVFSRRHKGRGSATCSRAQPRSIDVSSPRPELYVEYGTAKENSMHSIRWYVTLRMLCSHHTPMHVLASTNGVHAYSIPHYFRSNNRSTTGQSLTHSTSKTKGQRQGGDPARIQMNMWPPCWGYVLISNADCVGSRRILHGSCSDLGNPRTIMY